MGLHSSSKPLHHCPHPSCRHTLTLRLCFGDIYHRILVGRGKTEISSSELRVPCSSSPCLFSMTVPLAHCDVACLVSVFVHSPLSIARKDGC